MKISELMSISDSYTDEVVTSSEALLYANEAISYVNTKLGIELPMFSDVTTSYSAISDSWQRRLIVTWMNYSVKMKDSSLNEAGEYKSSFFDAFSDFAAVFLDIVSTDYLPAELSGVYTIDTTGAIDSGWFYNGSRGGL